MKVTYHGPFDEVVIAPTGQTVKHGHSVEVSDELAKSLLEQESNWRPTAKPKEADK